MTTYNTGNPVGSPDPRDLYDNAENLDEAINSTSDEWTDRLGRTRFTIEGVTNLATDLGTAAYRDTVGLGDVYAREGILGAVSQSSGVPTGAIIERGSNSNGEYVKFADGTAICTFEQTSSETIRSMGGNGDYASPYGSNRAIANWSFPVSFASAPSGSVSPSLDSNSDDRRYVSAQFREATNTGMNGISCTALSSSVFDGAVTFALTAIGRWY